MTLRENRLGSAARLPLASSLFLIIALSCAGETLHATTVSWMRPVVGLNPSLTVLCFANSPNSLTPQVLLEVPRCSPGK